MNGEAEQFDKACLECENGQKEQVSAVSNEDDGQPDAAAANIADYLYRCAGLTWQMEMDRYESLSSTVGRLLTCISIILVAVITAAGFVKDIFVDRGLTGLFVMLCFLVFGMLTVSIVVTLCSQIRFEYQALNTPGTFANCVRDYPGDFKSMKEAAIHFAEAIDESYKTLRTRNGRIQKLLSAAIICLLIAIVLIVVCALIGVVALSL